MTNKIMKKHDPLARKFLTEVSVAKDFLKVHLAPEIYDKCDIDSLTIESGSYIEEDLKVHCSDVVYKLNLKENGGCAYIYTLIEHQSSPDELMPLRILRYQLAIIQQHLDKHKDAAVLPIVAPMVFYNGTKSPYPYKCDIAELFANQDIYKTVQLGKFHLIDLTTIEPSEIMKHGKIATLEMLAKLIWVRDFNAVKETIIEVLRTAIKSGLNPMLISGAIIYVLEARETEEIKPFIQQLKQQLPDYEETIMTFAEAKKMEGMQLGEQKAQTDIAKQLIKSGVDEKIIANATHLTHAQIEKLKKSIH